VGVMAGARQSPVRELMPTFFPKAAARAAA
jgi:hypothetical protein